jgi:hypothetical protein
MKTKQDITVHILGGHRNCKIPAGSNCDLATNLPKQDDPVYWVRVSRKMDQNTKAGIRSHGILLKKSEIQNGIQPYSF